ncbi:MAG: hypothetical protein Kow00123_07130 [Anaerolineales bacterium]
MTRFILVHRFPPAATQDDVFAMAHAAVSRSPGDIRWLRSWVAGADGILFCEWEAPSAEAIRAVLEGLDLCPVEAIYRVKPLWFA